MKKALQECATLSDFEIFLDQYVTPRGVRANFGVIDGKGGAAYYETGNFKWKQGKPDFQHKDKKSKRNKIYSIQNHVFLPLHLAVIIIHSYSNRITNRCLERALQEFTKE